jgi:hypothetical protein
MAMTNVAMRTLSRSSIGSTSAVMAARFRHVRSSPQGRHSLKRSARPFKYQIRKSALLTDHLSAWASTDGGTSRPSAAVSMIIATKTRSIACNGQPAQATDCPNHNSHWAWSRLLRSAGAGALFEPRHQKAAKKRYPRRRPCRPRESTAMSIPPWRNAHYAPALGGTPASGKVGST